VLGRVVGAVQRRPGWVLASMPEVAQRVTAELDAVLGEREPRFEDLAKLSYLNQVIKETLRLYPPAPVMARDPKVAVQLGDLRVEPGSQIVIPIYAIHRHRRLWTDPDRFDPNRFLPESEQAVAQYMPFGAGRASASARPSPWSRRPCCCLVRPRRGIRLGRAPAPNR
jgi:cytochrome P450